MKNKPTKINYMCTKKRQQITDDNYQFCMDTELITNVTGILIIRKAFVTIRTVQN